MTDPNAVIAVYENHSVAEDAVKELQKPGFDRHRYNKRQHRHLLTDHVLEPAMQIVRDC